MSAATKLFLPMKVGQHEVSSRIVMAPLTRLRAQEGSHVPLPFVKEYYAQRASTPGTLIITEGTIICARGGGWANAPGIWSSDQIAAWKEIVDAVHASGGVIFMQLCGLGRVADASVLESVGGWKVKGPSAIALDPTVNAEVDEMSEDEIWQYVEDFSRAARNAIEGAGFDGVEVHAANGYLLDQFTQDTSNQRNGAWGGSIEKRARFALEITKAAIKSVGHDKVGFRVSPWSDFQGMKMKGALSQFTYLIVELKKLQLAYLHLIEARISGATEGEGKESLAPFIELWANTSPILLAGGFDAISARNAVDEQYGDRDVAIVFGRHFLSTPDLVYRMRHGIPLNAYDRTSFYALKQTSGYTDYPFSEEFLAHRKSTCVK